MATLTDKNANTITVIDISEAVGVFATFETLQSALYDLRMVGFSRYDISLLGDQRTLEEKLGIAFWRSADFEGNPPQN